MHKIDLKHKYVKMCKAHIACLVLCKHENGEMLWNIVIFENKYKIIFIFETREYLKIRVIQKLFLSFSLNPQIKKYEKNMKTRT